MSGVLVLGSLNVDHILRVAGLPRPGETVLSQAYSIVPGGKGRNQATAVAALGGRAGMAGAVGDDDSGAWLRDDLAQRGVDVSLVETISGEASGLAAITVDALGENTIVVHPGANARAAPVSADQLHRARYSVLLCCLEVPLTAVASSVATAHSCGVTTIVNAAPVVGAADGRLAAILDQTDVLIVNRSEAAELAGCADDVTDPVVAVDEWRTKGGPAVIVTLGADGAVLLDDEGAVLFAAHPMQGSSTVGAGDTFAGALALALAEGGRLAGAMPDAMAAAAAFLAGELSAARVHEIRAAGGP